MQMNPDDALVTVLMSGGLRVAVDRLVPAFEQSTGLKVKVLSGGSQGGQGAGTIQEMLAGGVHADLVILTREGADDLAAAGLIASGSTTKLGHVGLGIAVRRGADRPDVSTLAAYKATLLAARLIAMPGSTSGIWMLGELFPRLGIIDKIRYRTLPRGTDCTDLVAAGGADLTILPTSEILHAEGVDSAGSVAPEAELPMVFSAAPVPGSANEAGGRALIAFLASKAAADTIRATGLEPPGWPSA